MDNNWERKKSYGGMRWHNEKTGDDIWLKIINEEYRDVLGGDWMLTGDAKDEVVEAFTDMGTALERSFDLMDEYDTVEEMIEETGSAWPDS